MHAENAKGKISWDEVYTYVISHDEGFFLTKTKKKKIKRIQKGKSEERWNEIQGEDGGERGLREGREEGRTREKSTSLRKK